MYTLLLLSGSMYDIGNMPMPDWIQRNLLRNLCLWILRTYMPGMPDWLYHL